MNLLGFDDWQITGCEQNEHDMLITAKPPHKLTACPYCRDDKNLRRHALRKQIFSDLPIRVSRVKILIPRQRYGCSKCRGVSYQPLPEMDEKRVATTRLVRHVEKQCLTQTFVSISNAVGVSERTVRNIFGDYVERLDRERKWVAPQWLGIDEVYLGRKFRCILANVQERTITDMLPNRDLITVASYLRKLPNKRKIEAVCIDMHGQYREAVRDALPRAQIVVDSFHHTAKGQRSFGHRAKVGDAPLEQGTTAHVEESR